MHESSDGGSADEKFVCALKRAHVEGPASAEADLLALARTGHAGAARAALALSLRRPDGDARAGELLGRLQSSPPIRAVAWLLTAEWQRFHRGTDDDWAWASSLAHACRAGLPQALELVQAYAAWVGITPPAGSDVTLEQLGAFLQRCEETWTPPTEQTLVEADGMRVTLVRRFAPAPALRAPVAILAQRLAPTLVVDPRSGARVAHPVRNASYAQWLPELLGWHGKLLEQRLARAGAYARERGEVTNLLRYAGGQEYRPHLDCLPPQAIEGPAGREQGGQRLLTQLLGVVAAQAGGKTRFDRLDLAVTLGPGDLLTFTNADSAGGPLPSSRHAGDPVELGEKLILSKWVRETTTPYGRELAHTL